MLHGIRDLPGPGIKLLSIALVDGFFTTEPPGKSIISLVIRYCQSKNFVLLQYCVGSLGLFAFSYQLFTISFSISTKQLAWTLIGI